MTSDNFRRLHRLLAQVERILDINVFGQMTDTANDGSTAPVLERGYLP